MKSIIGQSKLVMFIPAIFYSIVRVPRISLKIEMMLRNFILHVFFFFFVKLDEIPEKGSIFILVENI